MINFRQYPTITKVIIPNNVQLSTNDFSNAFSNLIHLQRIEIPMNGVVNITNMCRNCTNLTTAVCGNNVTNMYSTYQNCTKLTKVVCGEKVNSMAFTYNNCKNIRGNTYFYPNNITSVRNCFGLRNTLNRLNIYVHNNSNTLIRLKYTNTDSLVGKSITWTNDTANNRLYNATQNIYIYPVDNVQAARIANGD